MTTIKRVLTSWQLWAILTGVFALMLLQRSNDLSSLLPFAVILLCPIMMIFMMGSHHHKK